MRAALIVLLAACAHEPVCKLSPPVHGAAFLWKVQGHSTLWLFGTIHNAGKDDVPPTVWAARRGAAHVVSELGDTKPDADELRDVSTFRNGPGLDAQLPPDDWFELVNALRGVVKERDLKRVRPWYAMSRLGPPAPSPNMDTAIDAHEALETWHVQMQALVDGVTIADLQETLHARRSLACLSDQLRASYLAGDEVEMTRALVVHPDGALLGARNARWLPQLEAYLANDGAFVAVGLGHLLGEHGIVAALRAKGYTVERAL